MLFVAGFSSVVLAFILANVVVLINASIRIYMLTVASEQARQFAQKYLF
jgi:hypothetical protein